MTMRAQTHSMTMYLGHFFVYLILEKTFIITDLIFVTYIKPESN
jgi:hypothetical protein